MQELKSGPSNNVDATKWEKDVVVEGFFVAREQFEGCSSPLLSFDMTGAGKIVAVWETAALRQFKLEIGGHYRIECQGKVQFAKGQGWSFKVFKLDGKESDDAAKKYAT